MRPDDYVAAPRTRRRDKLGPDPAVRREILQAASIALREHGVRGLGITAVLERAGLSTRAFYRHFASKDELVAAVFLENARVEKRRLRRRMSRATTDIEAVAAWIDGRLDLAFDETIGADLRRLSMEAQSQMFASPILVQPAYAEILEPLSDALRRGMDNGMFHHIDPVADAQFIHGVVWAAIDQQWAAGDCDRDDLRRRSVLFCLGGLGVTPEAIERICSNNQ
ncbi:MULTISPECIES: TetR/AcrR family transcriptional regulator [unclassified Mycobacterium]|uniref:TetR/AcrR family transcriptional regulator n=1 Tax=unclassified Mycobacterium TaxID=2642494 RepID=UPI0007FBCC4F|nr:MULTISPECIES: TetR/AcrR family transcriptional regulator [unclassified Mycobacterium]OBB64469.1 TetR family transcriptional regulator [Mycobacterium sp. 852014-50255_SCH5639931]OBB89859.1 TetR family transcriptional regulator [Mycobacterium sp. 852002-30065_SCH5024008]